MIHALSRMHLQTLKRIPSLKTSVLRACALILFVLALTRFAGAQAIFGADNVTVVDATGAIIPNARSHPHRHRQGHHTGGQSNDSGNFLIEHLIPDTYSLRIEASRFSTYEVKAVEVSADSNVKIDASLNAGSASQTVEVDTQAAQLKVDRADVSDPLTEQSLQNP